ncbi:MAG TPA: hypothetical protein VMU21_12350 [Thermodesulfovibrionales bacterium]|nr:hypothetical protein [Thermodesulfovibrionales bacterium]
MGLRNLSEAIILQSASDLLGTPRDKDALGFFGGEGFRLCAEMAKMDHDDKIKLLTMLTECISECKNHKSHPDKKLDLPDKKSSKSLTLPRRRRKSAVMNVA